jgi:predicted HTH transcriptional regulator
MINEGKILTNRMYREIFKVTNKTAATDLSVLVDKELAQISGKGRNVKYSSR